MGNWETVKARLLEVSKVKDTNFRSMVSEPLIEKYLTNIKQGGAATQGQCNNDLSKSRCRHRSNTSSELDLNIDNSSTSWMRDCNQTSSLNDPSPLTTSVGEVYSDLSLTPTPQDPSKCASVHFTE